MTKEEINKRVELRNKIISLMEEYQCDPYAECFMCRRKRDPYRIENWIHEGIYGELADEILHLIEEDELC